MYVREEFNRADDLENEGRRGTVGFALTILQRRLASSPEAILQSLRRRRERLEKRLREEQLLKRGGEARLAADTGLPSLTPDDTRRSRRPPTPRSRRPRRRFSTRRQPPGRLPSCAPRSPRWLTWKNLL